MSSSIPRKVLVGATTQATGGVSQMIKNGQTFSCQTFDLSFTEGEDFKMPSVNDAKQFLTDLFEVSFKSKPLNEKALAAMKAKGLSPKKQPKDLVLVMITASSEAVHLMIWLPDEFRDKHDLLKMTEMTCQGFDGLEMKMVDAGQMMSVDYPCETPFKTMDDFQRQAFTMLKTFGIYQDEEEDDEEMMTLNDL